MDSKRNSYEMVSNSLNLRHLHVCCVHTTVQCLLTILLSGLLFLPAPLHAAPSGQMTPPKVIEPSARPPLTFSAELYAGGAIVRWQVPEVESTWFYELYRSSDCSWEQAEVVNAPIFASAESTTAVVSYSMIDESIIASGNRRAGFTCNYWLLGVDSQGDAKIFDAAMLEGVQRIFLPVIVAGNL